MPKLMIKLGIKSQLDDLGFIRNFLNMGPVFFFSTIPPYFDQTFSLRDVIIPSHCSQILHSFADFLCGIDSSQFHFLKWIHLFTPVLIFQSYGDHFLGG